MLRMKTLAVSLLLVKMLLCQSGYGGCCDDIARVRLEKLKSLLKTNPDLVFSNNIDGFTPLHEAAMWGEKEAVELLLANHARSNSVRVIGVEFHIV